MFPTPPSTAVAAVALILVFSSSLAVCCLCVRLAGRRRYRPASRDELERAILPRTVSSPELESSPDSRHEHQRRRQPGSLSSLGKLTESIRQKLQRRRELLLTKTTTKSASSTLHPSSVVLNPGSIAIDCCSSRPGVGCYYDNGAFYNWAESNTSSGIGSASQGRSSRSGTSSLLSSGREFESIYSVSAAAADPPAPPQMMLHSEAYTRSRETEL